MLEGLSLDLYIKNNGQQPFLLSPDSFKHLDRFIQEVFCKTYVKVYQNMSGLLR